MSRNQSRTGYSRTDRVSDQLQQELARLIQQEVKDPRVNMVTVSGVRVSKDFSYAEVYVTSLDDLVENAESSKQETQAQLIEVLQNAAGYLRTELAHVLKLRTTPKLRFHYDEVIEKGNRIENLIKDVLPSAGEETESDDSSADE